MQNELIFRKTCQEISKNKRPVTGHVRIEIGSGGRLVLCNAVLNNLATYFMCSFLLPRDVLLLDGQRLLLWGSLSYGLGESLFAFAGWRVRNAGSSKAKPGPPYEFRA